MLKSKSFMAVLIILIMIVLVLPIVGQAGYSTASYTKRYQNIAGSDVVGHKATTSWMWQNGYLVNQKSCCNDWWAYFPFSCRSNGASWDYYNLAYHGFGQSNCSIIITSGIVTNWITIGSNYTSRIQTSVSWFGSSSFR